MRIPAFLLLLLLTACATTSPPPAGPSAAEQTARALLAQGKAAEAAAAFAAQAANSRSPQRDALRVQEADAWWLAKDPARARLALQAAQRKRLAVDLQAVHDLINAELQLMDGALPAAAALLSRESSAQPEALRPRWSDARLRLFVAQQRYFEAAAEQARAADLDTQQRRRIEGWLNQLSDAQLSQAGASLDGQHPLASFLARALNRRGLPVPAALARASRIRFGADVPAMEADGYRPPQRIAILLPLSGARAGASSSLRDGLMSAYFSRKGRRPSLSFYDTASTPAGAKAAQAKALLDGAQLIVGPLGRDELAAVLAQGNEVPVLALNRLPADGAINAVGFALSPEEEGEALAQRVIARGQREVQVMSDGDEFARRALTAFRERLALEGGSVITEVDVADDATDVSAQVQKLSADASRAKALLLFSKSPAARLLLAQLDVAQAVRTPRYATSLITSGAGSSSTNAPLNGVEFPELPWLTGTSAGLPASEEIGKQLPSARGNGARLFAFGHDAFLLAAHLEWLGEDPARRIAGASGSLGIDAFGNIRRDGAWATYQGGLRVRAP